MACSIDNFEELRIDEDQYLKYFCSKLLSDVTFVVGEDKKRIPGHKFILSHSSWEFFNVFNNVKLDKDELLIEDVTEETFLCFLKYCYTGKVSLEGKDGLGVLKLAYRFQMKHLIEKCETYLCEIVDQFSCCQFYTESSFLKPDSKLKQKILEILETNFVWGLWVNGTNYLVILPLEALGEIADLENIEADEMQLFNGIMGWARHNCGKANILCDSKNLRRVLGNVFYKIRFPIMKFKWFVDILLDYPKLFTTEETFDILAVINGNKKSCPKFSHNFRKRGYAFVKDPLSFDWMVAGKRVACFPGSFQLSNESCSEMSIMFRSDKPEILVGFAFVSRDRSNKKIISCRFQQDNRYASNPSDTDIVAKIKYNWGLSWDYGLSIATFEQKQKIEHGKWYHLYCKIDSEIINVKLDPPYPTDELHTKGLHIKNGKYNRIPYLIIDN